MVLKYVVAGAIVSQDEAGGTIPGDVGWHGHLNVHLLNVFHEVVAHKLGYTADGNKNIAFADGFRTSGTSLQQESHWAYSIEAHP